MKTIIFEWNLHLPSLSADDEPQPIKSDDDSWCAALSCLTNSSPISPRCIIILDILCLQLSCLQYLRHLMKCRTSECLFYLEYQRCSSVNQIDWLLWEKAIVLRDSCRILWPLSPCNSQHSQSSNNKNTPPPIIYTQSNSNVQWFSMEICGASTLKFRYDRCTVAA